MQLKNSTNDKTFRRIKNSQEERRGGETAPTLPAMQKIKTLIYCTFGTNNTHSHTHGSGAKSSKTPLGLASQEKSPLSGGRTTAETKSRHNSCSHKSLSLRRRRKRKQ